MEMTEATDDEIYPSERFIVELVSRYLQGIGSRNFMGTKPQGSQIFA